jgi:hypothetical protein
VAQIFSSVAAVVEFINSSEADAHYVPGTINTAAKPVIIAVAPLDRPMNSYIIDVLYGKGMTMQLRNKFPKTVINDYNTLTRGEFEARYNVVAIDDNKEAV